MNSAFRYSARRGWRRDWGGEGSRRTHSRLLLVMQLAFDLAVEGGWYTEDDSPSYDLPPMGREDLGHY